MGSTVRDFQDLVYHRESDFFKMKQIGAFGAILSSLDTYQGALTLKPK